MSRCSNKKGASVNDRQRNWPWRKNAWEDYFFDHATIERENVVLPS